MLRDLVAAAVANKEALEVLFWGIGLLGLFYAGRQLAVSEKQRAISESFTLTEKIDSRLDAWSSAVTVSPFDDRALGRSLGALLGAFEITAAGINRKHLSKMAREVLSAQILDGLNIVFSNNQSRKKYADICPTEAVCASLKIFILKNYKIVRNLENSDLIMDIMYGPNNRSLLHDGIIAILERRVRALRLFFAR